MCINVILVSGVLYYRNSVGFAFKNEKVPEKQNQNILELSNLTMFEALPRTFLLKRADFGLVSRVIEGCKI